MMRIAVVVATVAVLAGGLLFGLRWAGVLSSDAVVIGFATAIAISVVMGIASKRKG